MKLLAILESSCTNVDGMLSLFADGHHPPRARFGAFVECIESFDAHAFGISTSEAILMDVQQRMLLETASEAIKVDRNILSATCHSEPLLRRLFCVSFTFRVIL